MEWAYPQEYIEEIREEMRRRLPERRFNHSCEVARIALRLAKREGYDESRAELAGLLHDVAREYSMEQFEEAAQLYGIELTPFNRRFLPSIHGKVGAAVAWHELGIRDEELLQAVGNHVTGRPCMETLEQILYLADHITRGPEREDEFLALPLMEALLRTMGLVIDYDVERGKPIDERTTQTFDWLLDTLYGDKDFAPELVNGGEEDPLCERLDALLKLLDRHAVRDFPVESMCDLGGFGNAEGRRIRGCKILRSSSLDCFSAADYGRLAEMGISHVIDLRSEQERGSAPLLGDSGLRYLEIPFELDYDSRPHLQVLLDWQDRAEDPDEITWLTSEYLGSLDIDPMYCSLLFDSALQEKMALLFTTMLSDDCSGVLLFCEFGKVRAGIVTYCIMHALGMDSSVILDEHLASQLSFYTMTLKYLNVLRRGAYDLLARKHLLTVLKLESERAGRLNREILARCGSYRDFFDPAACIDAAALQRFRDKYLEAAAE